MQNEDSDIRAKIKLLPKVSKMLLDMVSAAWGTSVYPILPELIVSTDHTTEYIFEGTQNEQPKLARQPRRQLIMEDSKSMNGMQVKLMFTFPPLGNCFPLAVTVVGLTEKEMPGKDFVQVQIPKLCIGGGGVSVESNQQLDHLFLMRNTEGTTRSISLYREITCSV